MKGRVGGSLTPPHAEKITFKNPNLIKVNACWTKEIIAPLFSLSFPES